VAVLAAAGRTRPHTGAAAGAAPAARQPLGQSLQHRNNATILFPLFSGLNRVTFKAVFAFNVQQPAPPDSFYAVPPSLTNDESDIYIYIYTAYIYAYIYPAVLRSWDRPCIADPPFEKFLCLTGCTPRAVQPWSRSRCSASIGVTGGHSLRNAD